MPCPENDKLWEELMQCDSCHELKDDTEDQDWQGEMLNLCGDCYTALVWEE